MTIEDFKLVKIVFIESMFAKFYYYMDLMHQGWLMNFKSRQEWGQIKAFRYRKGFFSKIIILEDKFQPQKRISQKQAGIGKNYDPL